VKRKVRKHAERLTRKLDRRGVPLDDVDVRPPTPKTVCEISVELDGEHLARCARQLRRQPAAAGTKVEDELVRPDVGFDDKVRRKIL